MPKKTPSKELLKSISETSLELLGDIEQLYISSSHEDAMSAVSSGAELLAIASVDNDPENEGFRYLIGLRRGVEVTPHLTCFFQKRPYG
jgi:hypothetical protein